MKDAAHHLKYIQKKVLQAVRKDEFQETKQNGIKKENTNFNNQAVAREEKAIHHRAPRLSRRSRAF